MKSLAYHGSAGPSVLNAARAGLPAIDFNAMPAADMLTCLQLHLLRHARGRYAPSIIRGFSTWNMDVFKEPVVAKDDETEQLLVWETDPSTGDLVASIVRTDADSTGKEWSRAQVVGVAVGRAGEYTLHFEVACTLGNALALGQ